MAQIHTPSQGPGPQGPRILVELTGALGEAPLRAFLESAYRVGAGEALGLVVPRNLLGAVNRRLDPVVEHYGIGGRDGLFPGLLFLDPEDPTVAEQARCARLVVATSLSFQRSLSRHGVPWVGAVEGLRALAAEEMAAFRAQAGHTAPAAPGPAVSGEAVHAADASRGATSAAPAVNVALPGTASTPPRPGPLVPGAHPSASPRPGAPGRNHGRVPRRTPPAATGAGPASQAP